MRLFRKKKDKENNDVVSETADTAVREKGGVNDNQDVNQGIFQKLRSGLKKTHDKLTSGLHSVLPVGKSLDDDIIEEIEEQLYLADIGPRTVMRMCEALEDAYRKGEIENTDEVIPFLKNMIKKDLTKWDNELHLPDNSLAVILVVGVNGSGKTTSIGKLAHKFKNNGKNVLLAACDTFRAAAGEQLNIWADWTQSEIVVNDSADPAAVVFDAMDKALSKNYDVLIVDTAGRVHTKKNLMSELQKIQRVITKKLPDAPHEILMVLDANTGQNGLSQAVKFSEYIDLTGIILAKLDGTARGGIVFGMRDQIDIPVKFVGVGQQAEDLAIFDSDKFVEALFD